MAPVLDYYSELGVPRDADEKQIKQAYRRPRASTTPT